ncbi:MAG: hypothetical protein WC881_07445 [Elusimicrobiota bacterium]|jgi:hypothetical protein
MNPLLLALTLAPAGIPPLAAQSASTGPVIAEIRMQERLNVFDPRLPGEDWWAFRIANRIHFTTREDVIRREILPQPGDPFSELRVLESDRNLRAAGSFRRAEVRAIPRPDGRMDLNVRTQDSWTTNPHLSAGSEGGEQSFAYGIEEGNLFGRNKSVAFFHSQKGPNTRNDLRYTDPRLVGTRMRLSSMLANTSHGDSIGLDLARPFFELDTPYAYGVGWTRVNDQDITYRDGLDYSKFQDYSRTVKLSAGARLGHEDSLTQRWEAGWLYQRSRFTATVDTRPGTLPSDRELSGPTVGYSWVQPRYLRETYLDRMERVEDFNLGNELNLLGGYAATALSSDRDRVVFNLNDQQGVRFGPGRFALLRAGAAGRLARQDWDNTLLYAGLNLYWKSLEPWPNTWAAHVEAVSLRRPDAENQVALGGDTGLRGYKNNAFVGAKSVLCNLENRFFFPGEYFHLVRFGGAAFLDSGAVVPEAGGISFARFKSDIGAGLRISSTRSRSGGVLRIDMAYALDHGPGSHWVLSLRGGQAFDLFDNPSRRVRRPPVSRLNEISPPEFPSPK